MALEAAAAAEQGGYAGMEEDEDVLQPQVRTAGGWWGWQRTLGLLGGSRRVAA